jgi:putative spermidine/putrescine transport system ATP-binding protein
VAVFDRGRIVQIGAPADVYRRPVNRFVAEFLGAANLIEATIDADGRHATVAGGRLPLPDGTGAPGARILCVVRPEAIRMAVTGAGSIEGRVANAVYLGGTWDCDVALSNGTTLRVTVPASGGTAPASGDAVALTVVPDDVIVLDGAGE